MHLAIDLQDILTAASAVEDNVRRARERKARKEAAAASEETKQTLLPSRTSSRIEKQRLARQRRRQAEEEEEEVEVPAPEVEEVKEVYGEECRRLAAQLLTQDLSVLVR